MTKAACRHDRFMTTNIVCTTRNNSIILQQLGGGLGYWWGKYYDCNEMIVLGHILHCKAILGWGQPGLMRAMFLKIIPLVQDDYNVGGCKYHIYYK